MPGGSGVSFRTLEISQAAEIHIREGQLEVFEEGEQNKLIALVQKKLQRGDSVEKISDDLMESIETIKGIIDMINKQ